MPSRKQGRPAKDPDDLRRKLNLMFSPLVIDWLEAVSKKTNISKSALAENCIRIQMDRDGGDPLQAAKTSLD